MITYIFRKRTPTGFSIENLFDALYLHLQGDGLPLDRMEMPHISSGLTNVARNAWYVRRRSRANILHITGDVHYAALLCPSIKTVVTVHDCVALQRGAGFKKWVLWLLWFRLPLTSASAITVISEQTRRELQQTVKLPAAKITVIPNFVNPEFTFSVRPFNQAKPRVLHVGTSANKNLPRVIEALSGVSCKLVIVGPLDDENRARLKQHSVEFEHHTGVDNAAMARLYRDADLVSFPSLYEGFGMPILEAQASGRPVLTSDAEPMRTVAGRQGAALVDPSSISSLRDGFKRLIDDAALRDRLTAAGLENSRLYSIKAVAARYRDLYRALHAR